jgi:hypothetical protein
MSEYEARIDALAREAREERASFEAPTEPPDEERALRYLREGFGPTVSVYLEARTGGELTRFGESEFATLQRAMNDWLALYARCYGVSYNPDYTVRTAAELVVDTHDVHDTATMLMHVP